MQQRSMTASVRMNKTMQIEGSRRTRGRPNLTWVEGVRRDMAACNLTADMALNKVKWQNKICVADGPK